MVVIVDAAQVGDFSLGELSDYVAMVALGNPPLDGDFPTTSVLSMFDGQRGPGSSFQITSRDRSYLAGLYRSRTDASAQEQRGSIERRMRRDAGQAAHREGSPEGR